MNNKVPKHSVFRSSSHWVDRETNLKVLQRFHNRHDGSESLRDSFLDEDPSKFDDRLKSGYTDTLSPGTKERPTTGSQEDSRSPVSVRNWIPREISVLITQFKWITKLRVLKEGTIVFGVLKYSSERWKVRKKTYLNKIVWYWLAIDLYLRLFFSGIK